jgi:hypothetical protein
VATENAAGARTELKIVLGRDPMNAEARRLLALLPPE